MKPLFFALTIATTILLSAATPSFACDKDQAFNKMMAMGRAQQKMMREAKPNSSEMVRAAEFAREIAGVGAVLGAEDYKKACGMYDKIAKKYNVDIDKSAEGMVTMGEIRKDGGKRGGSCSQADASVKFNKLSDKMQDRAALGEISRSELGHFLQEATQHNDLIYSNPSQFCAEMDKLAAKYKIN